VLHGEVDVVGRTLMVLALISLVACDAGMSVRQINSFVESENAGVTAIPKLSVDVKTAHQLIGERWYSPQIMGTNSSDIPVRITSVELVAGGASFQNRPRVAKDYPVTLPANSAAPLNVDFRFSNGLDVDKVFRKPAELRIHYSSEQGAGLAHITLARGHPNAK